MSMIVQVKVIQGVFTAQQKQEIVARLTDAIVEIGGANMRPLTLEPDTIGDHIDQLYRAAWAMCGSREDAEDLVQETFERVLRRPRILRSTNEVGYLLRALRNTYASRYRAAVRKPRVQELLEADGVTTDARLSAREIMEAVAGLPARYRDAVIAVDLVGLSYREAARSLRTREATIATRLHRGRQLIARVLTDTPEGSADGERTEQSHAASGV